MCREDSRKAIQGPVGSEMGSWSLDDGVVVRPRGFKAVRKLFYRLDAGTVPDEKSYQCCCQAADHPNQILHACPFVSTGDASWKRREGLDAEQEARVSER